MNISRRLLPLLVLLTLPCVLIRTDPVPVTVRLPGVPVTRSAGGDSRSPVWAATNRFLFFVSDAPNLVTNDWNGSGVDLFRRDRVEGTTVLVSVAQEPGVGTDGPVVEFSVSSDGQRVAFVSDASNLIEGDTNGALDVFVRDLVAGTTTLVSWNLDFSGPGEGASFSPVISDDGQRVVYGTASENVIAGLPQSAGSSLCVRDVATREVSVISAEPWLFEASGDANLVVYATETWVDSVAGRTPTALMVWRASTGLSERLWLPEPNLSPNARPEEALQLALNPSGEFLAFFVPGNSFSAGRLVRGLWRANLKTGELVHAWTPETKVYPLAEHGLSLTDDGSRIAYTIAPRGDYSEGEIRVWSASAGVKTLAELVESAAGGTSPLSKVGGVHLSPGGDRMVFYTTEAVSEAGVVEAGIPRAFLRELGTGQTRVITSGEINIEAAFDPTGDQLAFSSSEHVVATGDENPASDVFVMDRAAGPPSLVSVAVAGTESVTSSAPFARVVSLSDDGRRILYRSNARDLVGNPASQGLDTYVYDVPTGSNQLVNVTRNGSASVPLGTPRSALSADGSSVVFNSADTNLVEGATYYFNTYLRVLDAGRTVLASPKSFGVFFGVGFDPPQVSGDGRRVAVRWIDSRPGFDIYDLQAGRLVEFNTLRPPQLSQFISSQISPDGFRVGFAKGRPGWFDYRLQKEVAADLGLGYLQTVVSTPSQGDLMVVQGGETYERSRDLFRARLEAGLKTLLVSSRDFSIGDTRVSGNGSLVVFAGHALGSGVPLTSLQVFAKSTEAGEVERISVGLGGAPANGDCRSPRVSGDGRFVVFTSVASNLVAGDTNGFADIFVRDRYAGITHLLSRRDDGVQENGHCVGASISGDGGTVAFTTFGTRLIPGDLSVQPTIVRVSVPITALVDADGDGLPDVWEQDHFGTVALSADVDSDGDGQTNLDEYRAHTSPMDSASRLAMAGARATPGGVEVDWHGHAGVTYQLERRESLADGADWVPVGEPVYGYEGLVHQEVSGSTPGAFFRVSVVVR